MTASPPHQLVSSSEVVRYVLYNHDNLAFKSTLHNPPKPHHLFMRTVCDLAAYISNKRDSDVLVKTSSDFWISAKKCNNRVLFTLVTQKNSHHLNALEEIKKTTSGLFRQVYFSEYKE
eukprot:sb/3476460/